MSGDICTELKRKADGTTTVAPLTKTLCFEKKCTDLIVLGLPFQSSEDDLRQYFAQFGDLVLVQVCCSRAFVCLTQCESSINHLLVYVAYSMC